MHSFSSQNRLIRKDYPLTGVLKLFKIDKKAMLRFANQEGLPAYWGIETSIMHSFSSQNRLIRKDYPLTGVLKLFKIDKKAMLRFANQEGLPAYWGILLVNGNAA